MSQGRTCRETILVSQLSHKYPHHEGNFEKGKKPSLLWGRDSLGGILGENLVIESQKLSRDSGETIFAEVPPAVRARHAEKVSTIPLWANGVVRKWGRADLTGF